MRMKRKTMTTRMGMRMETGKWRTLIPNTEKTMMMTKMKRRRRKACTPKP